VREKSPLSPRRNVGGIKKGDLKEGEYVK